MGSHNDLDKEIITPMDLTAQMNQFIPYEYALHAAVTILSLCQGSVVCFLVCLPVCAIHMLKLKNKEHKLHCITREEYCKPMYRDKIFNFIKLKLLYYAVLMVICVCTLGLSTINLLMWNIYGSTIEIFTGSSSTAT